MSEEEIPIRVDWTPFELLTKLELDAIHYLITGLPMQSTEDMRKAFQWSKDYVKWYEKRKEK